MKKNEFSHPQRQSQWAIIFIVLRFIRKLAVQSWPILAGLFIGRKNSQFDTFELFASGLGIFGAIGSIVAYYKFYYHITDKELVIQKGIFKKVNLDLPFERIQSINFKQNFLHQLLKVTEIEVESAGSKEKELRIDALSIEQAERLRHILLEKKEAASSTLDSETTIESLDTASPETILQLSTSDIFKVGITQNHFKPIGIILGLVASSYFYSYTFNIDFEDLLGLLNDYSAGFTKNSYALIALFILPLLVLYSVVTSFLKYHNLVFWRANEKFQVTQGLFTRRQFAAIDQKIQILSWGRNPLQRLLNFFTLEFRQAHSENNVKERFSIPGCDLTKIKYVQQAWLNRMPQLDKELTPISKHYFYRLFKYQSFVAIIIIIGCIYLKESWNILYPIAAWIILGVLTWISWKKKGYLISQEEVYIRGGVLDSSYALMPLHKVQNVSIIQNYYQWSRNLATVVVHTAAGSLRVPYIPHTVAVKILDELIYQAEKSRKSWM